MVLMDLDLMQLSILKPSGILFPQPSGLPLWKELMQRALLAKEKFMHMVKS